MRQPKNCWNPGKTYVPLTEHLDPEVNDWLEWPVKDLIRDYYLIQEHFYEYGIGIGISDFSYLITPAFKALEGALLQIARELGFDLEKKKYRVGWILDERELDSFYEDVLQKVETLTQEAKQDIRQWLSNARLFLRDMRHTPAHYLAEPKQTFTRAFDTGNTIIFTINQIALVLLKAGAFKKSSAATTPVRA